MRGRELLALLRAGAIDGLSIGFRTVKGRVDPKSRIRKLDQIDLWEISIVTFPLLAGARVRAVKESQPPSRPVSFARARAEREWKTIFGGASDATMAQARAHPSLRAPAAKRLAAVHARRETPPAPRRERIRGWISETSTGSYENSGPSHEYSAIVVFSQFGSSRSGK